MDFLIEKERWSMAKLIYGGAKDDASIRRESNLHSYHSKPSLLSKQEEQKSLCTSYKDLHSRKLPSRIFFNSLKKIKFYSPDDKPSRVSPYNSSIKEYFTPFFAQNKPHHFTNDRPSTRYEQENSKELPTTLICIPYSAK